MMPLRTQRLDDGRRVLLADFSVEVYGMVINVPAGTETDYSSIPSLASWIVRWSKVDIAGVVHDWLYRYPLDLTRKEIDHIWYLLALQGGATETQARLCYLGLRIGGWKPWLRLRQGGPHYRE